jgi:hypothetical protein
LKDIFIHNSPDFVLSDSYEQRQRLIGVIYLYDIHKCRVGGTAVRNIEMFRLAVGEREAKNVVILTTKWDLVDQATGERRYRELASDEDFFKPIIDIGATKQRYSKGDPPLDIIRTLVRKHNTVVLDIQRELVDEGKRLDETRAGGVLCRDIQNALKEAQVRHEEKMDELVRQINRENSQQIREVIMDLQQANDEKIMVMEGKITVMTMDFRQVTVSSTGIRLRDVLLLAGTAALSYSFGVYIGIS